MLILLLLTPLTLVNLQQNFSHSSAIQRVQFRSNGQDRQLRKETWLEHATAQLLLEPG
jgi:hypothetical protein